MRKGVRPNPKKDSDARRKARPGWHPIRATARYEAYTVTKNGKTYEKKRIVKK